MMGAATEKARLPRFSFVLGISVLTRIWIFFFQKRSYYIFFRELFAKERSYPSTTKLHDTARKQVRNLYIMCTEYTKQNIVPL